jgi:gliding motility-associated-like protein
MLMRKSVFIIIILLTISITAKSQIKSLTKDADVLTEYDVKNDITYWAFSQDSIFVFFSDVTAPKKGSVTVKNPNNIPAQFDWFKFNDLNLRFESFKTTSGVSETTENNLDAGGYKIIINDGINAKDTLSCWIFIDNFRIKRIKVNSTCTHLNLEPLTVPGIAEHYNYYDIKRSSILPLKIDNGESSMQSIKWESTTSGIIKDPSLFRQSISNPAPIENSKYKVSLKDVFGKEAVAETDEVVGIASVAGLKLTLIQNKDRDDEDSKDITLTNSTEDNDKTKFKGEAPVYAALENQSKNSSIFKWSFYNDINLRSGADSILLSSTDETPSVDNFFYTPGKYKVKLITENIHGCIDSAVYNNIKIDSSLIKKDHLPNAFTPNGDGVNDIFNVKTSEKDNVKSLKDFTINIYTKNGKKVYSFSGNYKDWEGWNGKRDNDGSEMDSGIYYYTIEATGWDKRSYKGKSVTGFIYLYK